MNKIALILFVVGLSGCLGKQSEKTGLEGKRLPSFTIFLADSSTYLNTSHLAIDKPIVLFYFGPYCPYCQAEMIQMLKNMKMLKDIQICAFTTYPFSDMKKFYEAYSLNRYANIKVGVDTGNYFAHYFKTQGFPYLAVYDRKRTLKASFIGNVPVKQIKEIAEN